jgi:hypothetical protein
VERKFAVKTTTKSDMTINFACFGRQQYRGSGGGTPRPGGAVRPYRGSSGATAADWSWKPDAQAKAAIRSGSQKAALWYWEGGLSSHLKNLSAAQIRELRTRERRFRDERTVRLAELEQTVEDQQHGWSEQNQNEGFFWNPSRRDYGNGE